MRELIGSLVFFDSEWALALSSTLTHFLWQGFVVAIVCYCCLERTRSAQVRYWMVMMGMIVIAICPVVTFTRVLTHEGKVLVPGLTDGVALRESVLHEIVLHGDESPNDQSHQQSPSANHLTGVDVADWPAMIEVLRPAVLIAWITGVFLSGMRLVAGFWTIGWLRGSRSELPAEWSLRCQRLARRMGLRMIPVFDSARIGEAAVVGFLKPVVLIPGSWLTSLSPCVLEAVIAHELAHLRRHDVWANLFQRFVETFLFYHPAVWWLSNRARLEREMCCDKMAVSVTGDRGDYANALEQVGRLSSLTHVNLATPFTGARKMNLLCRVKNVLDTSHSPSKEPAWLVGALAMLLPVVFALGMSGIIGTQRNALAQERGKIASEEGERGAAGSEPREGERGSSEAEAQRREAESRLDERRDGERREGRSRDVEPESRFRFRPETDREAALYEMIVQLRAELAQLRREVGSRRDGDVIRGDDARSERTRGDRERRESQSRYARVATSEREHYELLKKYGNVFRAYDKNGDQVVTLDEWLAMTNGNINDARRKLQSSRFHDAEPNGDGKFTVAEFVYWYGVTRHRSSDRPRESDDRADEGRGRRDGDVEKRGPRDGDEPRRGTRDGEVERRGSRDGDRVKEGPRDGDRAKEGPRDGERPERARREGDRE